MAAVQKILSPFDVFDYDAVDCPPHYGQIRHDLETRGVAIGAMDLLIAAHGIAIGATVVAVRRAQQDSLAAGAIVTIEDGDLCESFAAVVA